MDGDNQAEVGRARIPFDQEDVQALAEWPEIVSSFTMIGFMNPEGGIKYEYVKYWVEGAVEGRAAIWIKFHPRRKVDPIKIQSHCRAVGLSDEFSDGLIKAVNQQLDVDSIQINTESQKYSGWFHWLDLKAPKILRKVLTATCKLDAKWSKRLFKCGVDWNQVNLSDRAIIKLTLYLFQSQYRHKYEQQTLLKRLKRHRADIRSGKKKIELLGFEVE